MVFYINCSLLTLKCFLKFGPNGNGNSTKSSIYDYLWVTQVFFSYLTKLIEFPNLTGIRPVDRPNGG